MDQPTRTLRKRILHTPSSPTARLSPDPATIDIPAVATVSITSEDPAHPIENIFKNEATPGMSRWIAAEDGAQDIILDFDTPQAVRQIALIVEEPDVHRTQEILISTSSDGGKTYQDVIRQEYTFSPPGTTWEQETWTVSSSNVRCLRIHITPDKSGNPCRATLSSLVLS